MFDILKVLTHYMPRFDMLSNRQFKDGLLPVFVFPQSIEFYTVDPSSHKQIITIYNPYDFVLKFKVYCTAPEKYSVIEPEGTVKTESCIDIIIRHTQVNILNELKADKFRVKIFKVGDKKVIGQRDLTARLYRNKECHEEKEDQFEQLSPHLNPHHSHKPDATGADDRTVPQQPKSIVRPHGPDMLVVFIAVLCIAVLLVPGHGEDNSWLPDNIRVGHAHKLIAAFVLGMMTTVIIKS